ncbi:MAG: hypothetical protein V4633_21975 [Pseudomonadota bacterium]
MKTGNAFVKRFYVPLLVAIVLASLVLFSPRILSATAPATLEAEIKVAIIGLKIPLAAFEQSEAIVRYSALVVAALLLGYALNINFSNYFPQRLRLDAYFDVQGIERTLATFRPEDLAQLGIDPEWRASILDYDLEMVASLKGVWRQQGLQDPWPDGESPRDYFQCAGTTTFVVERKSFLTYKVTNAVGDLSYRADFPKRDRRTFRGMFDLRDTASNYIRPKFLDLLRSPSVLISPQFMQVFRIEAWNDSGTTGPFDHILVAATKVTLLPIPSFGDSVYLWRNPQGRLVPVSYCVYHAGDV